MRLFDLHCDTLSELYDGRQGIESNPYHISLENAKKSLNKYTQVMAIWSRHDKSDDENFSRFIKISDMYAREVEKARGEFFTPILAVEGAALLGGDLSRMKVLSERGVKILTLTWQGESCIGGAWDTDVGLTGFGERVVRSCFELGIVPDLSHSSDRVFYRTAELASESGKPIIVSHSNSRDICSHGRNITADMARTVSELGGIIGVNLVVPHIGSDSIEAVCGHIDLLSRQAGANRICLGCDFDGTADLPIGINNIADIGKIHEKLVEMKYQSDFIEAVFYTNAQSFAKRNFVL